MKIIKRKRAKLTEKTYENSNHLYEHITKKKKRKKKQLNDEFQMT